ncbi:Eco57I restriction-modification methylase domain-containing protein [Vibrio alginolyticus]|uniref:Eco57I restriction-modification methylase domain-containing protein n=1 Tax=Vibrio alginolyticus TaxID=663 RepID=UPI003D7C4FF3
MNIKEIEELQSKATEYILQSQQFMSVLAGTADKITTLARASKTEADVVYAFDSEYLELIKSLLGLQFKPSKEESVDAVTMSAKGRTNKKGRIDSRIGSVVIEFKHPSKFNSQAQIDSAVAQTFSYLHGLNKNHPGSYYGFVTDGISSINLRLEDGVEIAGSKQNLDEAALHHLTSAIALLSQKELSPENLVEDFCKEDNSIANRLTHSLLKALESNMTGRSEMLFMEWQELFRLAHDDKSKQTAIIERKRALEQVAGHKLVDNESEYKVLYALQTAYAIIVKTIAYKVISLRFGNSVERFNQMQRYDSASIRQHMSNLEDGAIFRDYGIGNLLEGDFFSWYCSEDQWSDEIYAEISSVYTLLAEYEDRTLLHEGQKVYDFFKDLYMHFIPEKVRHSLGEFYTPPWLAEHLVSNAISHWKGESWRALDPCCGSGTFITVLIEKALRREHASNAEKLNDVLNSVKGIDLNPLTVLTARINYFINISDLLGDDLDIEIPIYLGDSSYVPSKCLMGNVECVEYSIKTLKGPLKIIMPVSAISDSKAFSKAMSRIEFYIKALDRDSVYDTLVSLCDEKDLTDDVTRNLGVLTDKFIELENEEWNGIWARIVTNFLTTANIGRFDLIVGNPPWIDWKNLPAGYRERIKTLCLERHLFSGDGVTGGINLNICALISNVAAENWLSKSGVLSFLMPHNLIFQQTYEGFRDFEVSDGRLYLQELFDWSKGGHPFKPVTVKFSTYVYSRQPKDYATGIPVHFVSKKRGPALSEVSNVSNFDMVADRFSVSTQLAGTIHSGNNIFSYAKDAEQLNHYKSIVGQSVYKGREGVEFFPQELFLLEFIREFRGKLEFTNYQGGTRSKYKLSKANVLLEKDYLYPLVKGTQIEPFHVKETAYYVPFPYEEGSRKAMPINELHNNSPMLAKYFTTNRATLDKQTDYNDKIIGQKNMSAFYSLARVGAYTYGKHFVCFRDNTKWQAAVISELETPWGETKRPLFQNHAVSISQREDGSFIELDEAHFICAILNSPSVKSYMENSSDSRSFKIRPPVNIPEFSVENTTHVSLANLSKAAHERRLCDEPIEDILAEIDELVINDM